MKKISAFKIAVLLVTIGVAWTSIIFLEGQRISQDFEIVPYQTTILEIKLNENGFGYYKVFIPEFAGNGVFVQVIDEKHNVISDKNLETKMSVNYFEIKSSGKHTLKLSNVFDEPISGNIEFGETNSENMTVSGAVLIVGTIMLFIAFYRKLKNYNIAQPDENMS